MKKKINRQLMIIAALAVIGMLFFMSVGFYRIFRSQVMEDLKNYADVLSKSDILQEPEVKRYDFEKDNVRTTVVTPEGQVIYDSNANVGEMDNHAGRPEIKEALEKGEGQSIRRSSTMQRNTYYYTVRMEDGNVLRVARESHSIWSILYRSLPVMAVMIVGLMAVCLLLSHYLTKSIVSPIEQMAADMNHIEESNVYEELAPFAATIRQQHEAILANANMRQEFTANVSHELKTPLTAISGYSELIENGMASGQDAIRFAAGIHQSAKRLLTLINDIIKLSELDVMEPEIAFESINLYELAQDTVEMMQMRAEDRSVILSMTGSPCTIQGDKQMIEELIYNLCDNAIAYNNIGGMVDVCVGKAGEKVFLRVKDTGIGISKEHQERIFERFYRVDKSRSKSTGGTGLGLAIVKHIVAVHNAQIQLESEPGKGTEVTVIF